MRRKYQSVIWFGALIVVGALSFFSGKTLYYKEGYRDGVIFADSSSYKRGKVDGYRDGYAYCDSITEDMDSLRATEMFNLNIIFEELADPKKYIEIEGTLEQGAGIGKKRYVKARIKNTSSFARYSELIVVARFYDKRNAVIREINVALPDILYPRKGILFEIKEDVPDLAESVEFILESAQGMD